MHAVYCPLFHLDQVTSPPSPDPVAAAPHSATLKVLRELDALSCALPALRIPSTSHNGSISIAASSTRSPSTESAAGPLPSRLASPCRAPQSTPGKVHLTHASQLCSTPSPVSRRTANAACASREPAAAAARSQPTADASSCAMWGAATPDAASAARMNAASAAACLELLRLGALMASPATALQTCGSVHCGVAGCRQHAAEEVAVHSTNSKEHLQCFTYKQRRCAEHLSCWAVH